MRIAHARFLSGTTVRIAHARFLAGTRVRIAHARFLSDATDCPLARSKSVCRRTVSDRKSGPQEPCFTSGQSVLAADLST